MAELTFGETVLLLGAGALTWIPQRLVNVAVLPGLGLLGGIRSYLAPNAVNSTIMGPFDMLTRYGMYLTWGSALMRQLGPSS